MSVWGVSQKDCFEDPSCTVEVSREVLGFGETSMMTGRNEGRPVRPYGKCKR